jgi:polyphosphate glucokinase
VPAAKSRRGKVTLAVDVGSSHVKAHCLDARGKPLVDHVSVDTPKALTPTNLVRLIHNVADALPPADRVSVGIPGIVHGGKTYSVPVLGDRRFHNFPLADKLEAQLSLPVRVMNDGEMHGLGVIRRRGVELVLTFGTGLGTALYLDGQLGPRIQFVASPHRRQPLGGAYGDAARRQIGATRWSERVHDVITMLRRITNFDRCYVGGGNARLIKGRLPRHVKRVDNSAAALGGVRLWDWDMEP